MRAHTHPCLEHTCFAQHNYTVGSSGCVEVPSNPGVILSAKSFHFTAVFCVLMDTFLKRMFKFPVLLREPSIQNLLEPFLTAALKHDCFQKEVVPGSTAPRPETHGRKEMVLWGAHMFQATEK